MSTERSIVVARMRMDHTKAHCLCCGHKFRFLLTRPPEVKPGDVWTKLGAKEVAISGYCEYCFDEVTLGCEDEYLRTH